MSELDKLEDYLKEKGYTYSKIDKLYVFNGMTFGERHQIIVYDQGCRTWDAVCHLGSYGYEQGLLEIYGNIVDEKKDGDTVVGYLTAQDVINRLEGSK